MHSLSILAICWSLASHSVQSAPKETAAAATDSTELPLEPIPGTKFSKAKKVVVVNRYADGLWLSLGAGGGFGSEGPLRLGGSARISAGYIRPTHADHLGLSFDPSLQFAWNPQITTVRNVQTQGLAVALPVLASGNFVAGPGLLRLFVGPSFDYIQLSEQAITGLRQDRGWYVGLEAGVQYLFNLPVGLIGLDARFHYTPYTFLGKTTDGLLFSIGVTYAFTH